MKQTGHNLLNLWLCLAQQHNKWWDKDSIWKVSSDKPSYDWPEEAQLQQVICVTHTPTVR